MNKIKQAILGALAIVILISPFSNRVDASNVESLGSHSYNYSGGDAPILLSSIPLSQGYPQKIPTAKDLEMTTSIYIRSSSTTSPYYIKREYYLSPTGSWTDGYIVATLNGVRHNANTTYEDTPTDIVTLNDPPPNYYFLVKYTLIPDVYSKNTHIITSVNTNFYYKDTSPPTAPVLNSTGGWKRDSTVAIVEQSSSATGLDRYEYKIDNVGDWKIYYEGLLAGEGVHFVYVRAVDTEGRYSEVIIDPYYTDNSTPPVSGVSGYTTEWVNTDVRLILSSPSGIPSGPYGLAHMATGATSYPWNQTSNTGMAVYITNEGITQFSVRTQSNTGVNGIERTETVKIDKTAPPPPSITIK